MKSRTSFFNFTVFKKDITRFAPCWGLYTVMLVLEVLTTASMGGPYSRASQIADFCGTIAVINMFYGLITAQLLFGDLFNSRLCNGLHAMPLRRGSWFITHIISGLLFSLVPNILFTLLGLGILEIGIGRSVMFWWLLAATMQYLFFFGTAVLCVMLAGNRFAQIVLYGIFNFGSLLFPVLLSLLYEPLLYGVLFPPDLFLLLIPLTFSLLDSSSLIEVLRSEIWYETETIVGIAPGEGWGYVAICALTGIAFIALALLLYRKRKLECAGDFVAFRAEEPVLLVILTIGVGAFFLLLETLAGEPISYLFPAVGAILGFFCGLMLLRRTVRVFRPKAFLMLGLIIDAFGISLILTAMDPLGITRRVPELSQIKSITVSNSTSYSHSYFPVTLDSSKDVQSILKVHQSAVDDRNTMHPDDTRDSPYFVNIRLEYQLENGSTMNRFYSIDPDSEAGQLLEIHFSSLEAILGIAEDELPQFIQRIQEIKCGDNKIEYYAVKWKDMDGLLRSIDADCKAGNMAQLDAYHSTGDSNNLEIDTPACRLRLEVRIEGSDSDSSQDTDYIYLDIYDNCENTLKWLEENGLYDPESTNK